MVRPAGCRCAEPAPPGCPHRGPTTRSGYLPPSRAHSQGPRARNVSSVRRRTLATTRPGCPATSLRPGLRGGRAFVDDVVAGAAKGPIARSDPRREVERTPGCHSPPVAGHVRSLSAPLTDRARTTARERGTTATTHPGPPVRGARNAARRRHTFHVKHEVMSRVRRGPLRLSTRGVGSGLGRQPTASPDIGGCDGVVYFVVRRVFPAPGSTRRCPGP
jgi:hypothetical protein